MSKTLVSPVKRWPGTVTISDPLDIPQYLKLEQMFKERGELPDKPTWGQVQAVTAPAVFACVEKWDMPAKQQAVLEQGRYPMTPRAESIEFMNWLLTEITALFVEAEEAPNA